MTTIDPGTGRSFRVYDPMVDPDRKAPWTTLGKNVTGMTAEEAMEEGGLAFDVGHVPLVVQYPPDEMPEGNPHTRLMPERFVTFRRDTMDPLGIVGKRYAVMQNKDVLPVVDSLVGEGWEPSAAGTMKGGAVTFMVGSMPFTCKTGEFDPYLAFVNSFDASTGLRFVNTPIRPFCVNAVQLMLNTAKASFTFRHSLNVYDRVDEAREALGVATQYYSMLDDEIDRLLNTAMEEERVIREVNALIAMDEVADGNFILNGKKLTERQVNNRKERRASITGLWKTAPNLQPIRHTAWGWLNAVNEYEQWQYRAGDSKKRAERVMVSQIRPSNTLTHRAYARLAA